METKDHINVISVIWQSFLLVLQLRPNSFSMLYATRNKYIRAIIIIGKLKRWPGIPRPDTPEVERAMAAAQGKVVCSSGDSPGLALPAAFILEAGTFCRQRRDFVSRCPVRLW